MVPTVRVLERKSDFTLSKSKIRRDNEGGTVTTMKSVDSSSGIRRILPPAGVVWQYYVGYLCTNMPENRPSILHQTLNPTWRGRRGLLDAYLRVCQLWGRCIPVLKWTGVMQVIYCVCVWLTENDTCATWYTWVVQSIMHDIFSDSRKMLSFIRSCMKILGV
jgi:predicted phosphoadenosine phosphosulfate sulfurtransferase